MAERIYGSPGTLYQRCGGVFGVSGFVDRLMDRWMADDTLNANQMVARWHESAQRPGFKFLVVQIVCHLTGGPQQYTGRDMAASHKHLGISEPLEVRDFDRPSRVPLNNRIKSSWGAGIRGTPAHAGPAVTPDETGNEAGARPCEHERPVCMCILWELR